MTFRPLAKSPYWVELAAHVSELRLWQFFLSNFPLSRNVSSLKIGIFLLSFNWSFIKQVVISLPLKQMRRMLQEALRHEIIEPVLLTVMYLIRYFQGVRCVDCEINPPADRKLVPTNLIVRKPWFLNIKPISTLWTCTIAVVNMCISKHNGYDKEMYLWHLQKRFTIPQLPGKNVVEVSHHLLLF